MGNTRPSTGPRCFIQAVRAFKFRLNKINQHVFASRPATKLIPDTTKSRTAPCNSQFGSDFAIRSTTECIAEQKRSLRLINGESRQKRGLMAALRQSLYVLSFLNKRRFWWCWCSTKIIGFERFMCTFVLDQFW